MKSIEKMKRVVELDEYVTEFDYNNIEKCEAEFALDYAKERFTLLSQDSEYLDNKADQLIKYFGVIVGLLGALMGYIGKPIGSPLSWMFIVGIITGILSMGFALWVRKPRSVPYPMSVIYIFKLIKVRKGEHVPIAAEALSFEKASVRLSIVNSRKGYLLWFGYILLILAMTLLFLNIILRG